MKWTHVSDNGKTLRTWDTTDDGLFPEVLFDAMEGNIFSIIFLAIVIGIPLFLFIIYLIYKLVGG